MSQPVFTDNQTNRFSLAVLLLISLLGLVLRLYALDRHGLWLDEIYSARFSSGTIGHVLSNRTGNPPTYYLMLNLWTSLAGKSESAYRMPSVFFGAAAIFMTGLIGIRFFARTVGIVAAILMAIQIFPIHYAREARVYTIFLCLSLATWWFLLQAITTHRKRPWIFYGIFLAFSCYAHNYWIFNAIGQLLYLLVHHRKRSTLVPWGFAFAGTLLLYIPWTFVLAHQAATIEESGFWIPRPEAGTLLRYFRNYSGYLMFPQVVWGFLALAILGLVQNQTNPKRLAGIGDSLPFWLLCPILIPFTLSFFVTPFFFNRYTLAAVPSFYLLIACGIQSIRFRWIQGILVALLVILGGISLHRYFTATAASVQPWEREYDLYPIQDWREFIPNLVNQMQPQEWVAVWPPYYLTAVDYYLAKSGNPKHNRFVSIQFPEKLTQNDAEVIARRMEAAGQKRFWLLVVKHLPEDRSSSLLHLLEYGHGREISFAPPPGYFASIYRFDSR